MPSFPKGAGTEARRLENIVTKNEFVGSGGHTVLQTNIICASCSSTVAWGPGPWPENTLFANNIFYVEENADFYFEGDKGTQFANNCFYGHFENMPEDPAAIFEDPQFKDVLARGDGFEVLKNFMLLKASPCKDAGANIENNGGQDLFGNPIEGLTNIGVHEF